MLNHLLSQLPRLWLHGWQALKRSHQKENEERIKIGAAWMKDKINWEMFKSFLEDQLVYLKEEGSIEDSLKDVTLDEQCTSAQCTSFHADSSRNLDCPTDDEYYDYEDFGGKRSGQAVHHAKQDSICKLCNQQTHRYYWDCQAFMKMKHGERFELFINPKKNKYPKPHIGKLLGECAACLKPNEKFGHKCNEKENVKKWICAEAHQRPVHILCCKHHVEANAVVWEQFQFNTQTSFLQGEEMIPVWKRQWKWQSYHLNSTGSGDDLSINSDTKENMAEELVQDEGLFLLQKVVVDSHVYNVFYDTGCGDFCITKSAVNRLGDRATQIRTGIFRITGAGNVVSEAKHGIYGVNIPLENGKDAKFVGVCMDQLTNTFCEYNVSGIYAEIVKDYVTGGGEKRNLPFLTHAGICGGDTDIMIGIKYNRYQPRLVHQLESGLAIYRSAFQGVDGSTAVIGGPHPLIAEIEREFVQRDCHSAVIDTKNYLSHQLQKYLDGYDISPDSRIMIDDPNVNTEKKAYLMKNYKSFLEFEDAGTEISYRCLRCRCCKECKCGPLTEELSRKEESEQHHIDQSVEFNIASGKLECVLPLLEDPAVVLGGNERNAQKIYQRWISKLHKNPQDLKSVLKSERKLQDRGHVEVVKNLAIDVQKQIEQSSFKYFLPWRPVWNKDSLSTPCRITFDASDITDSGVSLNDILPKGINQISSLLEIIIQWRNGKFAMSSDIEQMYNGCKLMEKHWPLQLYLWNDELNEDVKPDIKVVKTLIYGVRSSGNQAITRLKRIAQHSIVKYPDACETLNKHVYVDDILPGGKNSLQACYSLADELVIVLDKGGLKLKRFAFSTVSPESSLSPDGVTVDVAGMKWATVADELSLKIGPLNFGKKYRGKRSDDPKYFHVPKKLTRRICIAKLVRYGTYWDNLYL